MFASSSQLILQSITQHPVHSAKAIMRLTFSDQTKMSWPLLDPLAVKNVRDFQGRYTQRVTCSRYFNRHFHSRVAILDTN